MDKDTSQLQLYQHFLSFFMPEGILDFFEPVWMETQSLDSRESKKDILYSSSLHIYLDERDNRPDDLFTFLSNKEGYCKKGSIVAAVRGTKAQDVVEVLLKIPEEQRLKVKEVTMDLSESMADIVKQAFPNATIVLDCFHIMRRCNDAIEEMRLRCKREAQAKVRKEKSEFRKCQKRNAAHLR